MLKYVSTNKEKNNPCITQNDISIYKLSVKNIENLIEYYETILLTFVTNPSNNNKKKTLIAS